MSASNSYAFAQFAKHSIILHEQKGLWTTFRKGEKQVKFLWDGQTYREGEVEEFIIDSLDELHLHEKNRTKRKIVKSVKDVVRLMK